MVERDADGLSTYARASSMPLRFLAAGYVVVAITYRSRNVDPQSQAALADSLAAVDYLRKLSYVDPKGLVIYGSSGGGDLALEVAAATDVAAIAAEEPATVLFTGILNKEFRKAGPTYTPADAQPINAEPKRYYTIEYQRRARQKIDKIRCPILIVQGDQDFPVNRFNAEVFIPELLTAGKNVEVITYPREFHGFAFNGDGRPGSVLKAFDDLTMFFARHLVTKPKIVEPSFVTLVPVTGGRDRVPIFLISIGGNSQTPFAGVWKTEMFGRQGVAVELKTDGDKITGTIVDLQGLQPRQIDEGKIDGDILTFGVTTPDGRQTVVFTGRMSGDQITLTRELQSRSGGDGAVGRGIFSPTGPRTFIVRQTP